MGQFPKSLDQASDVALSDSGDLLVSQSGDLDIVTGIEALQQEIIFRLKTHIGDYRFQPQCGASLDTFFGAPQSQTTGQAIQAAVITALTHDGLFAQSEVTVITTPESATEIQVEIQLNLASRFTTTALAQGASILSLVYYIDLQEGSLL